MTPVTAIGWMVGREDQPGEGGEVEAVTVLVLSRDPVAAGNGLGHGSALQMGTGKVRADVGQLPNQPRGGKLIRLNLM